MVLALAMLFVGGRFAATAVLELRDPYHPQPFPGAAFSAHLSEDIAALNAAMAKSYQQHAVAVRVNLASRLLVGLLMLLAAAAVFTSNLQARLVAIVAAYAAIAQQIGDMIFGVRVFGAGLRPVAGVLTNLLTRHSGAKLDQNPTVLVSAVDLSIAFYVVGPVLGIVFSIVLLTFFGGRRGRTFFGVGAGPNMVRRQPHHGG